MASMSTVLTEFADYGNSRTYTQATHSAAEPKLVLQKRKVPSGNQTMIEDSIQVLASTEDSDGAILSPRVTFTVTVRRPIDGIEGDVTAMLAVFRDIVAGDEFANTVSTQEWLV